MAVFNEDKDRKVIPRWRRFSATLARGELTPLTSRVFKPTPDLNLQARVKDWQEHGSLSFAADLLSCAITLGLENEAREAAEYVMKTCPSCPEATKRLAQRVLGLSRGTEIAPVSLDMLDRAQTGKRIHEIRQKTHGDPRNVFLWVDMARCYTMLGMKAQAVRCLDVALRLLPNNRFILRSASRLYIHLHEYDLACKVLRASDLVTSDPWVLAAHIAAESIVHKSSRHLKKGLQWLNSERFRPVHLSELASAIATLEIESGGRWARRFLRLSLQEPTENAIAQASWIVRKVGSHILEEPVLSADRPSSEARAWTYSKEGKWEDSLKHACEWLVDQPFSNRPAVFASYIAALLENYTVSANLAQIGRLANPNSFALLNNYAFAQAQAGHLSAAIEAYNKINEHTLSLEQRMVWRATGGLLKFRSGDASAGRSLYLVALGEPAEPKRRAMAMINHAIEESLVQTPEAESFRKEAIAFSENLPDPDIKMLVNRLRKIEQGQKR